MSVNAVSRIRCTMSSWPCASHYLWCPLREQLLKGSCQQSWRELTTVSVVKASTVLAFVYLVAMLFWVFMQEAPGLLHQQPGFVYGQGRIWFSSTCFCSSRPQPATFVYGIAQHFFFFFVLVFWGGFFFFSFLFVVYALPFLPPPPSPSSTIATACASSAPSASPPPPLPNSPPRHSYSLFLFWWTDMCKKKKSWREGRNRGKQTYVQTSKQKLPETNTETGRCTRRYR